MNAELVNRLVEAGVDPFSINDPAEAWLRLYDRFGLRATLIDRYALEAEHRGINPKDLPATDREVITSRVLEVRYPGIEFVGSPGGHSVQVVSYDQQWPELFADWRQKLSAVLGKVANRIDHVGSTAVPETAAKPIIDIQISVADVENEDAYVLGIESTGVPLRIREPGHRYFRPPPDQPRVVQLHVCDTSSRWERDHLLFRDYLRTNPAARNAYTSLKLKLADTYRDDRIAYNEAKTGFILDTLEVANDWARATGWNVPDA